MSRLSTTVDSQEIREILRDAVDLYVHTSPELLPRRLDDIALAKEMHADGFRAALMWNQFSHTGERAAVASLATGFDMRGSIVLNGTVGGVDPRVTEYAVRMGARYVSMPTLSGGAYQGRMSTYAQDAATLAGPVPVTDETGSVLAQVHDVLDVIAQYDVVLGLGYLCYADSIAVLRAAREQHVQRIAVLRPFSVLGLTPDQVEEAMAIAEVVLEFPASSLRATDAAGGRATAALSAPGAEAPIIAAAIKRYGADHCVLMSDTGWNDLTALDWLTLGSATLLDEGVGPRDLQTLVRDTPARLIGIR